METATEMHCEQATAVRDDSRTCEYCQGKFLPRRSWARFCSTACRTESNAKGVETGIEVKVTSIRVLKRGALSVILRVDPIHRHQFESVAPGLTLRVNKP